MKIILFLEQKFYQNEHGLYADKVVDNEYIKRYISVFDKVVICARKVNDLPSNFVKKPIVSEQVEFLPLPNFDSKGIIFHKKKIRKNIQSKIEESDGVIIRSPSSISYLAAYILQSVKKPIAVELVADARVFFSYQQGDSYLRKAYKYVANKVIVRHTKQLTSNANAVLYVTKEFLEKEYPCKSITMGYNSTDYFMTACSDVLLDETRYSSNIFPHSTQGKFIICHTGALSGENKGQRTVINIVKKLIQEGIECEAHFIGDGSSRAAFEEYTREEDLSSYIFFHGQISNFTDIQKIYSKAHLFLFPSISEGLPRALIEAMANSLPCLAYLVGGIGELLPRECTPEVNDREELYKMVHQMIDDESYRVSCGMKNYQVAREYASNILDQKRNTFYQQFYDLCVRRGKEK